MVTRRAEPANNVARIQQIRGESAVVLFTECWLVRISGGHYYRFQSDRILDMRRHALLQLGTSGERRCTFRLRKSMDLR